MPKGLKIMKFIEGPRGQLIQDNSYVGEDAWDEDPEPSPEALSTIIDSDKHLSQEEKKNLEGRLGISGWCLFSSFFTFINVCFCG